jgi:fibronectin type 3 domain-containing protein
MTSTPITGITSIPYTKISLLNNTLYYFAIAAVNATGTGENSNQVSARPIAAPVLTLAALGDAKAGFTWTAATGATSYTLKRSTASGGPYTDVAGATDTAALLYTDTGLTNNQLYYYIVVANNATGSSGNSNQVSARPIATPTLTAVAGSTQVVLNWNPSAGATSYTLRYGTTTAMTSTPITGITSIPYTKISLLNNTLYYFAIAAVNATGTGENSNQVSATPAAPPAAPTGVTAIGGDSQVIISWNASAGAATYIVRRSTLAAGGPPYTDIAPSVATTTYTDVGRTNGTTYYYVVAAVGTGTSANSAQVSATPNGPPAAPLNLTAIPGNAKITLSWATSTNATGYSLQRSLTVNGVTTTIPVGNLTTYIDQSPPLTNGQAYFYVVVATNGSGTSPKSNKVSATPQVPSSIVITLAPTPSRCSQQTVPSSVGVVEVRASSTISGGYPPYTAVWSPAPFWMSTSTSPRAFLATYRYATTVESFATVVSPKIILTITDAAFGTASTSRNFVPCPSAVSCKVP